MGYIALGDLISKAQVEKCGKREFPVLSMTMHDGIVFQNDRFKKDIASIDRSNYSVVGFNQLVVSFPIDEGVLAVQDITEAGIVSPAYKIWDIDQALLVPKYLEMWLRSPRSIDYYKSKLRGTTARRRSIPEEDFLGMRVNVLPKEEQERIVDLITRVKGVILLREQELVALDDLIKARFVEMFGDETNPYQWPVVNVEDVANVSVGVVIKPAQYYTDAEHGVKAFRSLNIGAGTIKDSDWVYFSHEGNDKNSKSQLRENDLLIVRSGAPGTACVVPKVYEGCNAIDIIIARPETDKVNPYYLCTYTNLPHGKRQIDEGTGGAAQQHFNVGKYNKLQLMLPPLKQQNEFVSFLEQIDKSKSVIQKSLEETQLLFDSLMQEYFG